MLVQLEYSISSAPILTMNFEFDQNHGPRAGLELDNGSYSRVTFYFNLPWLIATFCSELI